MVIAKPHGYCSSARPVACTKCLHEKSPPPSRRSGRRAGEVTFLGQMSFKMRLPALCCFKYAHTQHMHSTYVLWFFHQWWLLSFSTPWMSQFPTWACETNYNLLLFLDLRIIIEPLCNWCVFCAWGEPAAVLLSNLFGSVGSPHTPTALHPAALVLSPTPHPLLQDALSPKEMTSPGAFVLSHPTSTPWTDLPVIWDMALSLSTYLYCILSTSFIYLLVSWMEEKMEGKETESGSKMSEILYFPAY